MLSSLFRSASILAVGTALGQGIVLLATPWLARLYGPAEYGVLALLLTVTNIAIALACLRYDLALPGAEERHVRGLIRVCVASAAAVALLGAALALLAGLTGVGGLTGAFAAIGAPLVACCVFAVGLYQIAGAEWLRRGWFLRVALLRVAQGAGFVLLAGSAGLAGWIGTGLLWAQAASFLCGLVALLWLWRRAGPEDAPAREAAAAYCKFPLMSLPGAVLDVLAYSTCIWIITAHYGNESAGHYSQIQRLIGAPMMLVSISLGQVLLKQTAMLREDDPGLQGHLLRVLALLMALGGAAVGLTWLIGEPLLALILGEGWRTDTSFIVLVTLAVCVRACVSPISAALISLQRFDVALRWQALYFVSSVAIMPWLAGRLEFDRFVLCYAIHEAVLYGFYAVLIFRTIRKR